MKRNLLTILALAAALCLLATTAGAGTLIGHTHSWKEIRRTESTCTTHGKAWYRCECGQTKSEDLPTKGHAYGAWEVTTEPTCEAEGVRTHTCSACGRTETRPVDALGHDWGEGVVTKEPGYLNPGERTYTCSRCGATKTEEISAKSLPISLRNGGIEEDGLEPGELDPLHITVQPAPGFIDRDGGSLTLSVEAEGGVQPYTYQWKKLTATGWLKAVWKEVKNSGENTLEVTEGYRFFYCTVYDNAGNHVDSDKVLVDWNLYISQQPENTATCEMDPVILTCKASGGTRFTDAPDTYYYTWFDSEGNTVGYGSVFEVPRGGEYNQPIPDEYHCVVEDAAGNTVTSQAAIVYDADPFETKTDAPVVELLDGQDYELWAEAYGGIGPYTGVWLRDGVEIPTQQTAEGEFTAPILGDGSKEVVYTFLATDAMDDSASCTVTVIYPQLKIAQEPQGGMLSEDGETPVEINVVMEEGEEPFKYYLYENGVQTIWGESGPSYGFSGWKSGEYYIHIEDATGRWADSDVAVVTDFQFQIDHIDVSGELTTPEDNVTLTAVTNAPAVRYIWWFEGERNGYVVSDSIVAEGTDASYTAHAPGLYKCTAYDAQGRIANQSVRVNYTGTEPLPPIIIHQPQNVVGEYNENNPTGVSASFTCLAVTWDGSQDLSYQWQDKSLKNGQWVNRWTGQTRTGTYTSGTAVRCIVTDTRTGEQVISNEAIVSISLHGEITYVGGYAGKSEFTEIAYIITGGKAPYTVKIFADRILGGPRLNPNRTSYMVKYTTVSDNLEHSCLVTGGRNYEVYYENMITGETYVQGEYLEFYLEITDANNNTYTSAKKR